MKLPLVHFIVLSCGLAGGYALGKWGGRAAGGASDSPLASGGAQVPSLPDLALNSDRAGMGVGDSLAPGGPHGGSVKALLTEFDPRKPVESHLRVLQSILAASPQELGELMQEMAGKWQGDPGWFQAKQAVLQRWVEVAPDEAMAWAKEAPRRGVEMWEVAGIYGALAQVDSARALREIDQIKVPGLKQAAMSNVVSSIALTDPRRALRVVDGVRDMPRHDLIGSVFNVWASQDPMAAAAAVMEINDPIQRRHGMNSLIGPFSQRDPDGAFLWASGLKEPGMRLDAMRQVFDVLGSRSPEHGLAMVDGLPKHQQIEMHRSLIGSWSRSDPEAAQAWILGRSNPVEKQQFILAAANHVTWMAPESAASLLTQLAPGSARESALENLIRNWSWRDPSAAREFALSLPDAEQARMRGALVESLAWRDPEAGIALLKEFPLDDPAHRAWGRLAGALAEFTSPEKALEWARGLDDDISRRQALPEIFQRLAAQDPATAAREAMALPDAANREDCLTRVANAWAGNQFDDALTWARGLTGKDREAAMGAVLTEGARHEPSNAAQQYRDLLATMPAGDKPADSFLQAASSIAGAYFAEDQSKAAAWVSSLPHDDAQAAAARSLAEQWARYDAPSASEWIGTLPYGKPRDQAVGTLVTRIAASDPAMAFEWAATVQDVGTRHASLEAAVTSWRKLDAEAARAAVRSAGWPEDEQARWLEKLR